MNIFLTIPPYDLLRKGYGIKSRLSIGFEPPLGLAYIAAVLREAGHEVKIFDPLPTRASLDSYLMQIEHFKAHIIGISTLTCTYKEAKLLAAHIKKYKDIPIIIGGPHCFTFPQETLEDGNYFDIVVSGEAEDRIVTILEIFKNKKDLFSIPGICFRKNGSIIKTSSVKPPADLDKIPFPARDLFNLKLYSNFPNLRYRKNITWMITSRGCPYRRCTFCYQSKKDTPTYRRRSVDNVIAEIEELIQTKNIQEITFLDETLIYEREWILDFCDEIKKRKLHFDWSCQSRISSVTHDLLYRIREAGCYNIYYGIESGNQELLDFIQKGHTLEQIRNVVRWTKKAGIEIIGSFILGLPKETPIMGEKTIQFAIDLDLEYAIFHPFHPDKGTLILNYASSYGKIISLDNSDFAKVNYLPNEYELIYELQKLIRLAYRKFYLRPNYIFRRLKEIRKCSDIIRYIKGFIIFLERWLD